MSSRLSSCCTLPPTRRSNRRLYQGLRVTALGLAIGLAGSLALTRLMRSLLYDVSPTDAITLAAMSLVLLAVAVAAMVVPARRATRVEPTAALRYE